MVGSSSLLLLAAAGMGGPVLAGLHRPIPQAQRTPPWNHVANAAATPAGLFTDQRVSTVVLRTTWPSVDPDARLHVLTHLENEVRRDAYAGKAASPVSTAGWVATPALLRPQLRGAERSRDGFRFHASHSQWLEIPTFWDPDIQRAKRRLIVAAGGSCCLAGGQAPSDVAVRFRAAASTPGHLGLRDDAVYAAATKGPLLDFQMARLAAGLEPGDAGMTVASPLPAGRRFSPLPGSGAPAEGPGAGLRRRPAALPRATGLAGAGREVQMLRLNSAAFRRPVTFGLWLPPGYERGDKRYPVLYWLHGKGGDPQRSGRMARYFAQAIAAGTLPPMLVVFPDGDHDSFYSDAPNGSSPVETMVIRELIPHIDRQYRTLANRADRHIEGFSMGGFGALKFAAKYPDLFASVVAYGAPRLDADLGMGGSDQQILADRFGGDLERFRRETPAWWFTKNRDRLRRQGLRIRLVAGSVDGTRHSVARMHQILLRLGLPHEYKVYEGVPHVPMAYYEADGNAGYALHGRGSRSR